MIIKLLACSQLRKQQTTNGTTSGRAPSECELLLNSYLSLVINTIKNLTIIDI